MEKTFKEKESPEDRVKRLRIRDWNDDAFLVAEHLRQPSVKPRDPNVWTKTPKERKLWKKFRRVPAPNYNWPEPVKTIDIPGTLVVYVKGGNFTTGKLNPKTKKPIPKTTFSHKCIQSDIPYILGKYKTPKSEVLKYSWNGKTYSPDNLPFWESQFIKMDKEITCAKYITWIGAPLDYLRNNNFKVFNSEKARQRRKSNTRSNK